MPIFSLVSLLLFNFVRISRFTRRMRARRPFPGRGSFGGMGGAKAERYTEVVYAFIVNLALLTNLFLLIWSLGMWTKPDSWFHFLYKNWPQAETLMDEWLATGMWFSYDLAKEVDINKRIYDKAVVTVCLFLVCKVVFYFITALLCSDLPAIPEPLPGADHQHAPRPAIDVVPEAGEREAGVDAQGVEEQVGEKEAGVDAQGVEEQVGEMKEVEEEDNPFQTRDLIRRSEA